MRLGHGPDASVSQYPTRQFVPSVWVQATYHARVCVTTCYQSSGTLTRTNHIVRCAGLSCPRNYAISGLCKRRTLFVDAFISAIEWPRIPAWCLKTSDNWGRSKTGCQTGRIHKYEWLRIYNDDYFCSGYAYLPQNNRLLFRIVCIWHNDVSIRNPNYNNNNRYNLRYI